MAHSLDSMCGRRKGGFQTHLHNMLGTGIRCIEQKGQMAACLSGLTPRLVGPPLRYHAVCAKPVRSALKALDALVGDAIYLVVGENASNDATRDIKYSQR